MIYDLTHSNKREPCWEDARFDLTICQTKKRRIGKNVRVRFKDEVVVHEDKRNEDEKNDLNKQSPPMSTWLTPNDFTKIKNNVCTTLEFIKVQGVCFGFDTPLSFRYCSRGLEDYDTEQKCTKFSTVQRRKETIQAVLREQEFQRRQLAYRLQEGPPCYPRRFENYHPRQTGLSGSTKIQQQQLHLQCMQRVQGRMPLESVLDESRISDVYMNHTFRNVENAIYMGRKDSEDALMIYRSKPLPLTLNI